jgi:hypothetical protein
MMQTDVLSAHLNSSGQMVINRTRLKGIQSVAAATAGTVNIWDTTAAPTAMTYGRSGTTITVTLAGHGLTTGQSVGLVFATASGVSATNGNYVVTVTNSSTFTVTDINSGTIATGTAGSVGTRWLTSFDTAALTTSGVPQTMFFSIPGEGMLAMNGIYAQLTNQTGLTVFYG